MKKRQFYIDMHSTEKPVIKVIGGIESWMAEWFRASLDALIESGAKDAVVYLSTPGGDLLAAWDMYNAVRESSLKLRCRTGAICASAGTLFLSAFDDCEAVDNCMFMIHQPSAYGGGTEDELRAQADQLAKIKPNILKAYAKHMGKSEDEVQKIWADGDCWMTADEAKAMGLVKKVVSPDTRMEMITKEDIEDLGEEYSIKAEVVMSAQKRLKEEANNPDLDMKQIKMMAAMLAIANPKFDKNSEDEAAVIAEMQVQGQEILMLRTENQKLKDEAKTAKEEAEKKQKTVMEARVEKLIKDGAFAEDMRESLIEMATKSPDAFNKLADNAKPHQPISMSLNGKVSAITKIGDKTVEELTYMDLIKTPTGEKYVAALMESNPELVAKMKSNPNKIKAELE